MRCLGYSVNLAGTESCITTCWALSGSCTDTAVRSLLWDMMLLLHRKSFTGCHGSDFELSTPQFFFSGNTRIDQRSRVLLCLWRADRLFPSLLPPPCFPRWPLGRPGRVARLAAAPLAAAVTASPLSARPTTALPPRRPARRRRPPTPRRPPLLGWPSRSRRQHQTPQRP